MQVGSGPRSHRGVVYDWTAPPADPHFQLTREQFAALRPLLVGLPIRVEHAKNTVGRVVAASVEGDREFVEWELEDNASGWTASKLTDMDAVRELSLKHVMYADGRLSPVEVSLCEKGARPGTVIVKASAEDAANYKTVVPPASAPAPVAVAPEAVAVAPVATEQAAAPAAAAPVAAEQVGQKRRRLEDPMAFLKEISNKVTDQEALQSIADMLGEAMEDKVSTQHEVAQLREAKALLEKANDASKESAKTIVGDVVAVLSDLFGRFAPNTKVTEEQKTEFANLMESNPNALNYIRPLVVAASAIHAQQQTTQVVQQQSNSVLDQAMARIGALQSQLGVRQKMGAPVQAMAAPPAPQWTAPAAAPMVEVAASGNGLNGINFPSILQNLPKYDGSNGVGRVTNDSFMRRIPVMPQQPQQ